MLERRRLVTPAPQVQQPSQLTSAQVSVSQSARQQRRLRRPVELIEAIASLDVTTDEATRKQLLDWIRQVYEERGGGQLIGLFSRCYLGHPYVDHRMTLDGAIAEHYTAADAVPDVFLPCRGLARSNAYAYIEVYGDGQVIPIRSDGNAAAGNGKDDRPLDRLTQEQLCEPAAGVGPVGELVDLGHCDTLSRQAEDA